MAGNRESFYSSQTYQEAEAQVGEMEGKIQREREERKQREERYMRERFKKELQDSEEDRGTDPGARGRYYLNSQ